MVRISSITLDTLLELVGGQVIDELGEDSLSGIHPSLSKIRAASGHPALAPGSAAIQFKSKNESYTLSLVICDFYRGRPDFSRTLLFEQMSRFHGVQIPTRVQMRHPSGSIQTRSVISFTPNAPFDKTAFDREVVR